MVMICPYCDIEINEKLIEAEDGCCPECGALITASTVINEDDEDDPYNDEFGDEFDDDELDGDFDDGYEAEYGEDVLNDDRDVFK